MFSWSDNSFPTDPRNALYRSNSLERQPLEAPGAPLQTAGAPSSDYNQSSGKFYSFAKLFSLIYSNKTWDLGLINAPTGALNHHNSYMHRMDSIETAGSEISDLCHSIAQLTKGEER